MLPIPAAGFVLRRVRQFIEAVDGGLDESGAGLRPSNFSWVMTISANEPDTVGVVTPITSLPNRVTLGPTFWTTPEKSDPIPRGKVEQVKRR
jgi:hypothetical protein